MDDVTYGSIEWDLEQNNLQSYDLGENPSFVMPTDSEKYDFTITNKFPTGLSSDTFIITTQAVSGTPVKYSMNWTDNVALSGYIFSFDNCTGTFVNDSWASFGSSSWSNVTKNVNTTAGCTLRWCVYANDTSNNWNDTSCSTPFSYRETTAPSYSNNQTQLVSTYTPTGYSNFSITWSEGSNSVNAYLENNFTGSLKNITMPGTYTNFYYNSSVLVVGAYQFRFVANDSYGNSNATATQYFTILYTSQVGSALLWTWKVSGTGENVRSGTPYNWTWQAWSFGSNRKVPQGSAVTWTWNNE
jgi:hypothetical protein